MTTSLRIIAVVLGLFGVERIVYADVITVVPGMVEPMPALGMATGLVMLIAAIGLFLGYGWARWPAIIGAAFVVAQGLGYVLWGLSRSFDTGYLYGLLEPIIGAIIIWRLLRHWPPGVSWSDRLR